MLSYRLHLPNAPTNDLPVLVLLHGRGADADASFGLARFFSDIIVLAPQAPYPAAPWGYGPGFAWYRFLGDTTPDPRHFEYSLTCLDEFLGALPSILPVRPGPLFLGGFSQGGTMSLGYTLAHPGAVHTVINLSGFLAAHPLVRATPETVASTRIYWPHGLYDTSVPHRTAVEGRQQLLAAGACLAAPDFPIDHTMVREEIADIRELLRTA